MPTIALLNCTGNPDTCATRREIFMILVVSTPVWNGMMSLRTFSAITTSSSAVLPARSPRPLMVAFDLARARLDGRQRVGRRHAEVVVAMGGEDHLVGPRHALHQHPDEIGRLSRGAV